MTRHDDAGGRPAAGSSRGVAREVTCAARSARGASRSFAARRGGVARVHGLNIRAFQGRRRGPELRERVRGRGRARPSVGPCSPGGEAARSHGALTAAADRASASPSRRRTRARASPPALRDTPISRARSSPRPLPPVAEPPTTIRTRLLSDTCDICRGCHTYALWRQLPLCSLYHATDRFGH